MSQTIPTRPLQPGPVIIFGSGETSPGGRRAYEWLLRRVDSPARIAILETPAGFEPNSPQVAGQVAEFLRVRLQNYTMDIRVIPARKKGTPHSPDDPQIVAPMLDSDVTFLGPGSPTYAVRQLHESRAWNLLRAQHRLGAAIILASAASVAASRYALPVYEIYKVGLDLHWQDGLDLFGDFGLPLLFIPHWNNNSGGDGLDTSRCYMGQARFQELLALLPGPVTVVGIDEETALIIDPQAAQCSVLGKGGVTIVPDGGKGAARVHPSGADFPLTELGAFSLPGDPRAGIPAEIWQSLHRHAAEAPPQQPPQDAPPPDVLALVEQRRNARHGKDWRSSDVLRAQIASRGWRVVDTPSGQQLEPIRES